MVRKLTLGAFVALVLSLTTVGVGTRSASAEVTNNTKFTATITLTNPCNGLLMTLTGDVHMLWYTTPEGHTIMRYNARYTGADTAGTEYVVNIRRVMDHDLWPTMFPFDDLIVYEGVSLGKGENFRMVRTVEDWPGPGSPAYTVESVCRG